MTLAAFDVAITTYRRPDLAVAAARSALAQGDRLARVIVVDDASGDDTAARLAAIGDPRLVVHVRAENGGIGAARADALARSTAPWTVHLDSDHELLPGALDELARLAARASPRVGILGGRFRWDTGRVTPHELPTEPIDYLGRIAWADRPESIGTDYVCAVDARVRARVPWSPRRSGLVDVRFHLDAARVADALFTPAELALQRSDAPHGHTRGAAASRLARRVLDARDAVALASRILDEHGAALEAEGPRQLVGILRAGALHAALLGDRRLALAWIARAARHAGPGATDLALLATTLAGPRALRAAYLLRG